jgi:DNA-binding CsgD family transcriptional regulator
MVAPVTVRGRDLRALAGMVSADRPDLPDGDGLPPSLLADLKDQVRCDQMLFLGLDTGRQADWFAQGIPPTHASGAKDLTAEEEDLDRAYWKHYRASQFCSYPGRAGDLRSIIKVTDFYSTRQWHSTGMYTDFSRLEGVEHTLMLCLPETPPRTAGLERHLRLYLDRGPGPDFSERDRAVLTLLRPHLHQAYLDAQRRRHSVPPLTPRQQELLRLVAAGHTNTQLARHLGISEGTVRTHLENIYSRLNVSSRTAAVTRAFPDRVA